jgi:hypothetical protein
MFPKSDTVIKVFRGSPSVTFNLHKSVSRRADFFFHLITPAIKEASRVKKLLKLEAIIKHIDLIINHLSNIEIPLYKLTPNTRAWTAGEIGGQVNKCILFTMGEQQTAWYAAHKLISFTGRQSKVIQFQLCHPGELCSAISTSQSLYCQNHLPPEHKACTTLHGRVYITHRLRKGACFA